MFSRLIVPLVLSVAPAALLASDDCSVAVIRKDDRVRIEIGGKLFTEYCFDDGLRPYCYPLLLADGTQMTRGWPQKKDASGEEHDHNHHHSLWFGHANVNGINFWVDSPKSGTIVQTQIVSTKNGEVGILVVKDNWAAPDGKIVCSDKRTLRFGELQGSRFLDFEITIYADHGPVVFGDTKDGTMAIRVNEALRVTRKDGKNIVPGTGHIVNSAGGRDDDTWGMHAEWCDYYGPLNGRVLGVAIFDAPTNPRHSPRWHVRDYGLFAVNPFGEHDYDKSFSPTAGNLTIAANESATFSYRFYFHEGDPVRAGIQEHYDEWSRAMKTTKTATP